MTNETPLKANYKKQWILVFCWVAFSVFSILTFLLITCLIGIRPHVPRGYDLGEFSDGKWSNFPSDETIKSWYPLNFGLWSITYNDMKQTLSDNVYRYHLNVRSIVLLVFIAINLLMVIFQYTFLRIRTRSWFRSTSFLRVTSLTFIISLLIAAIGLSAVPTPIPSSDFDGINVGEKGLIDPRLAIGDVDYASWIFKHNLSQDFIQNSSYVEANEGLYTFTAAGIVLLSFAIICIVVSIFDEVVSSIISISRYRSYYRYKTMTFF